MFAKKHEKERVPKKWMPFFLRKKIIPKNIECVPKGNDLERVPSVQERFFFKKKSALTFLERVLARSYIKWWIMVSIFLGKCSYKGTIENDNKLFRWDFLHYAGYIETEQSIEWIVPFDLLSRIIRSLLNFRYNQNKPYESNFI